MPTFKQKQALKKILENRGNISKSMREVGYASNTAKNPKNLTESKGWKELLAEIDDEIILSKIRKILLSDDKRASLSAADMLLKLKDKYPASKTKIDLYEQELKDLTR